MTSYEFKEKLSDRAGRAGLTLDSSSLERLETYYRLLARWNSKTNLTALPLIEPTDETFDRLLVEPLAASRLVADFPSRWFDLGSGGGSPAIPLKVLRPQLNLTMVEARSRKAAFLREASRILGLADVRVQNARFEELAAEMSRTVDLITLRAVRGDAVLFEAMASVLADEGRVLWFGAQLTHDSPFPGFRRVEVVRLLEKSTSTVMVLQRLFHVEQNG